MRQDQMLFAITPGHKFPDTEDVVQASRRFGIVRKHADVEHVVRDTDPRREADA